MAMFNSYVKLPEGKKNILRLIFLLHCSHCSCFGKPEDSMHRGALSHRRSATPWEKPWSSYGRRKLKWMRWAKPPMWGSKPMERACWDNDKVYFIIYIYIYKNYYFVVDYFFILPWLYIPIISAKHAQNIQMASWEISMWTPEGVPSWAMNIHKSPAWCGVNRRARLDTHTHTPMWRWRILAVSEILFGTEWSNHPINEC